MSEEVVKKKYHNKEQTKEIRKTIVNDFEGLAKYLPPEVHFDRYLFLLKNLVEVARIGEQVTSYQNMKEEGFANTKRYMFSYLFKIHEFVMPLNSTTLPDKPSEQTSIF